MITDIEKMIECVEKLAEKKQMEADSNIQFEADDIKYLYDAKEYSECLESAKEYRHIAELLKELKEYREFLKVIKCFIDKKMC